MSNIVIDLIVAFSIGADLACCAVQQLTCRQAVQPARADQPGPTEYATAGVRAFPGIYVRDDD